MLPQFDALQQFRLILVPSVEVDRKASTTLKPTQRVFGFKLGVLYPQGTVVLGVADFVQQHDVSTEKGVVVCLFRVVLFCTMPACFAR